MALKGKWVNRVDGTNYVKAEDVNSIAQAVIELEDKVSEGGGTGTGDMKMSVYDTNGDGIVDNAASLGGINANSYATTNYVITAIENAVGLALEGSY